MSLSCLGFLLWAIEQLDHGHVQGVESISLTSDFTLEWMIQDVCVRADVG